MREFGLAVGASTLFFSIFLYATGNELTMKTNGNCSGECYQEYVTQFGDVVEHEKRKQQLAAGDPFSDIRSLWAGCAACHGGAGEGGIGPKLTGQTTDYISSRLITYKNNGTIGPQSALMWGQAAMLSDAQITQISKFIEEGLPAK